MYKQEVGELATIFKTSHWCNKLKRILRCILISVVHRQDIAAIKPTIFNVLVHNSDSNTNWIFLPISEFEERQQCRSIFIAPIYWQYNTQGRTNFTKILELFFQVQFVWFPPTKQEYWKTKSARRPLSDMETFGASIIKYI